MAKTRIAVLGLGGVGGYFGGLLADKYFRSDAAEIIFIGRKKTAEVIREKGLKLITPAFEKTVHPDQVISDPAALGKIDLLISATKSYDLEESLLPLRNSISPSTSVLPLLNGVDSKERIRSVFPDADIWEGCVYIVSRLAEPGVIRETGNIHKLYFGSSWADPEKLKKFERIFCNAGIDAMLSENIQQVIWEKFLFISTIASLTSYLDRNIGEILSSAKDRKKLLELFQELISVAAAKQILFPPDIMEKQIARMEKLPYETTSSMHSDLQKGGKTEYASLTEYVVKLGREHGIRTPAYGRIMEALRQR